jgi:hypothetical protein
MIVLLKEQFTQEEQEWYIGNLYMYMNYHPTNDFPINLDHVFKMIGFATKGNAKRTLENNFVIDEDYKLLIIPREKKQNAGTSCSYFFYTNLQNKKKLKIFRKSLLKIQLNGRWTLGF